MGALQKSMNNKKRSSPFAIKFSSFSIVFLTFRFYKESRKTAAAVLEPELIFALPFSDGAQTELLAPVGVLCYVITDQGVLFF